MSQVQRILPEASDPSDVARVVRVLRQSGPLLLSELLQHPDLEGWGSARVDGAVVGAWSRALISVDARDLFVAL
jgi:hypothetical protein